MDNLRTVVKMLFRQISPTEILAGSISYDKINDNNLLRLANVYMPQYSNDEIKNMVYFLANEFEWHHNKARGEEHSRQQKGVNVFDALFVLTASLLIEENGMPFCRYEHLLRWRDVTLELDEDLMVTAFLAYRDLYRPRVKRDFFWRPVIGHNNRMLNRMLEQGIAENHFHLKGSAPLFHLSWISMMNDVRNPVFYETLREYDNRRLHQNKTFNVLYPQQSLTCAYQQAALIRMFLYCELKQITLPFFCRYSKQYGSAYQVLLYFLNHIHELEFCLDDLQSSIFYLQARAVENALDYTIDEPWLNRNPHHRLNEVITGERYFLYSIFKKMYSGDEEFSRYGDIFYLYIIVKSNIRTEMIQSNQNVGFDNFYLYQMRKEFFIDNTPFEPIYVKMAVHDTILNQHILKLEARIAPKQSAEANKEYIDKLDDWITVDKNKEEEEKEELLKRFFYVFHFIKGPDVPMESDAVVVPRHHVKREEVKHQALEIAKFRRMYVPVTNKKNTAARVKGIDACNFEMECRPEVFAQAFRFLKDQTVYERDDVQGIYHMLPNLNVTYHVGEDNYDIIDGLRAIDEAISFLNMRCGDRLGHALALGVDVEEWYESKAQRILIPAMNYLDNLVWLHAKIRKFRLTECNDAIQYIEQRYNEYFRSIYLNNIHSNYFNEVMEKAFSHFAGREISNNYMNTHFLFTINTYYDSWKLRGDNPQYFKNGYFCLEQFPGDEWDEYGVNKIFPDNYRIRYNPEAAFLYHLYHYSREVREAGARTLEIKINSSLVKAVKIIQRKMQKIICDKGIAIETNPSSNFLIGSFKRYDKHPIISWYNHGLTYDYEKLEACPQIQVSINTDDQGVFATCLENEYALLALALEKMKNDDGTQVYNRTMIGHWLDHIRKMGLVQSFDTT